MSSKFHLFLIVPLIVTLVATANGQGGYPAWLQYVPRQPAPAPDTKFPISCYGAGWSATSAFNLINHETKSLQVVSNCRVGVDGSHELDIVLSGGKTCNNVGIDYKAGNASEFKLTTLGTCN